jgi:hypothetical protein
MCLLSYEKIFILIPAMQVTHAKWRAKTMQIKVISSKDEISSVMPNETFVHIAFRPTNKQIIAILDNCPKLEAIQIPKSYCNTLSDTAKMLMKVQNVALLEGDVWGHRADLHEYHLVSQDMLDRIGGMKAAGNSRESIESEIKRLYRLSDSKAKYIVQKVEAA